MKLSIICTCDQPSYYNLIVFTNEAFDFRVVGVLLVGHLSRRSSSRSKLSSVAPRRVGSQWKKLGEIVVCRGISIYGLAKSYKV